MSWEGLGSAAERGPIRLGCYLMVIIFVLATVTGVLSYACGWFGEAGRVTQDEFGPEALLVKYEWFKDALASLDRKKADIGIFRSRVDGFTADMDGIPRADWDRDDKQTMRQLQAELTGVLSSYNALAATYNSQMAKFNWRFCNRGTLPEGAPTVLPREVAPYEYSLTD